MAQLPRPRALRAGVVAVAFVTTPLSACAFWELDSTWSEGASEAAAATDASHEGEVGPDGDAGYAEVVLADDPLGYWKLDEPAGTIAHDSSGNGHDGVVEGAIAWNATGAVSGSAAAFAGGMIIVGNGGAPFDFVGNEPFTIEAWASPSLLDEVYRRIVSMERPGPPRDGYNLWVVRDDAPSVLGFELLSNDRALVATTPISTGVTVHVVAVYEGPNVRLYANGVLVDTKRDDAVIIFGHPGRVMWGGSVVGGPANFTGVLDELAIYDRALDATRIASHFAAGRR